ncbi:AMP-binding protein [Mycobacterium sp. C31M]
MFAVPQDPEWIPEQAQLERSRLLAAMRSWGFPSLEALHRASVDDADWFWRAVVDDLDIGFTAPFQAVRDASAGTALPQWFVGGRLNVFDLCCHRHAAGEYAGKPAVVFEGDDGRSRQLTYAELDEEVTRLAANLIARDIGAGDRVVLFLPVVPEAVVAFLACAAIGAISVPAFTGYGAEALAIRLQQSEAKAMVTADTTTRRGKTVRLKQVADEAMRAAPAVDLCVVVAHTQDPVEMRADRDVYWHDLDSSLPPVPVVDVESNEALTIIYTSGTTGAPKGIVHSHAGFAVKAAVDFAYGFDIHPDDVIAWTADMGWMLGPLLIMGGLQLGATIVLVEGVPDHPEPTRLWDLAERHGVTFLGIAPTAARLLKRIGAVPARPLTSVRAFGSTGEAWDDITWRWLFDEVGGGRRPIVNYSGGTETGGGILVSYPFLPATASSFNGPLPGMDVAVLDDNGRPVTGEVGELAVRNTWPGMTHAFWRDTDRYLKTYWSRWDGIWVHGDLASIDPDGTWRVHGRSDDTIKVSGRRIGPAEVEAALLRDPRIVEAAVIGMPDELRGQRLVAFVVPRDDSVTAGALSEQAIQNVGKSFAPTLHVVRGLPKTKNGKIMRRVIRSRHLGEEQADLSALDPSIPIDDIPTYEKAGTS